MAEEKKEAPKKDEQHWAITFFPILIIIFLLVLGTRMGGETIFGEKIKNPEADILAGKKNVLNIYEWIGVGEIERGARVINTTKVTVRNAPAGSIVGTQKKLDTGIVRDGPISEYNVNWVRVDYAEAPDGWVLERTLSAKVATVRGVNIIPILYNFYKPIGYTALFALLILFLYFKIQLKKEERISEKKIQLKLENAKERPVPTSVRISQKPDAQEIPGFQTEEIMPIEQLEKQNRWIHIQELIKSYNANDWRQAIIEADIILEEMLEKMQYEGVTIGDKLKNVERSDFITLDKAWSAHKVRNQIAHDGSNFKLTRELAEKTIKDFEEVFREFYYI
jgi:hypothetical protein